MRRVILDDLTAAKAFADLDGWRKITVNGRDALDWLNDLVTADVSRCLRAGRSGACCSTRVAGSRQTSPWRCRAPA